ncbi:MAG: hypothetical protein U0075_06025 [Thermomicrobiales bacterium]
MPELPGETSRQRRDAIRALGVMGASLFGAASMLDAAGAAKRKGVSGEKKKRRHRKKRPKLIGLASALSDPFTLGANQGATVKAVCPAGYIGISGGLEGESEVTAPCMIRESHVEPDGQAWKVNVYCLAATNTPLRVGVICFSEDSFRLPGDGRIT